MFKEYLTLEGESLLAKSIAGKCKITFTKMEAGNGNQGNNKNIQSLQSKIMSVDIYSVEKAGDSNVLVQCHLDSQAIPTDFYFREKGIYATDGNEEILFSYGVNDNPEWLENVGHATFQKVIRTVIAVASGDKVSITLQKGALASAQDIENVLQKINEIKLDGDWATLTQGELILRLLNDLQEKLRTKANASSALSTSIWTDTRAGYIDLLADNTVGLRALSGLLNNMRLRGIVASKTTRVVLHSGEVHFSASILPGGPQLRRKMAEWIAPYNGSVFITATMMVTSEFNPCNPFLLEIASPQHEGHGGYEDEDEIGKVIMDYPEQNDYQHIVVNKAEPSPGLNKIGTISVTVPVKCGLKYNIYTGLHYTNEKINRNEPMSCMCNYVAVCYDYIL